MIFIVTKYQLLAIKLETARLAQKWKAGHWMKKRKLVPHVWIFPDGSFQEGCQDGVLNVHAGAASRSSMMKAGCLSVEFCKREGSLTLEGCREFLGAGTKAAVLWHVATNAKHIRSVSTTLYDARGKMVQGSGWALLSGMRNRDKIHHVPKFSDSAHGKSLRAFWQLRIWQNCEAKEVGVRELGRVLLECAKTF